jgi:hypothetical protein
VGDYSNAPGECYEGTIVNDVNVREGFAPDVRLELIIDVNELGEGNEFPLDAIPPDSAPTSVITSSDGRFNRTPITQMVQLPHDSLSLFQFPGGRVRSYLAYTLLDPDTLATVIVSLMENEDIEVRILKPLIGDKPALFGVFRLAMKERCI